MQEGGGQHHQISGGGASLGDHPDGDGWENAETSGGAQSSGEPTEFFESETLANFFAVVNISWAAGKAPEALEEVIASVSRQMDEQIVKERLEETISYNVSNEKNGMCGRSRYLSNIWRCS